MKKAGRVGPCGDDVGVGDCKLDEYPRELSRRRFGYSSHSLVGCGQISLRLRCVAIELALPALIIADQNPRHFRAGKFRRRGDAAAQHYPHLGAR